MTNNPQYINQVFLRNCPCIEVRNDQNAAERLEHTDWESGEMMLRDDRVTLAIPKRDIMYVKTIRAMERDD